MGQNTSRQSKTRSCCARIVRAVSAALWLGAAAWTVWIAVTRWTGVPAAFQHSVAETAAVKAEIEHGAAMFAILEAIPPPPQLPPPPEGMVWRLNSKVDVDNARRGAWIPPTRPGLRHLIEYFASAELESALSHIAEIRLDAWRGYVRLHGASAGGRAVRSVSKLLVARARWHFAEHGDFDSALADLNLIYRLVVCGYQAGAVLPTLVVQACESLADSELRKLSQEYPLTRAQATTVADILRERARDPHDTTNALLDEWRWLMDRAYTDDAQGNGWLVLSYTSYVLDPQKIGAERTGAWNVLSPIFNGRKVVAAKIGKVQDVLMKASGLSYVDGQKLLVAAESRSPFSILDGPLARGAWPRFLSTLHGMGFQRTAGIRATIIAAALSAFRHDSGQYPESLSLLAGDYLDVVPNDPFIDRPFRYERTADDKYLLYSVGRNAIDDGGPVPFDQKNVGNQQERNDDRDYSRPRGDPYNEPTLEKSAP